MPRRLGAVLWCGWNQPTPEPFTPQIGPPRNRAEKRDTFTLLLESLDKFHDNFMREMEEGSNIHAKNDDFTVYNACRRVNV